MPFSLKDAFNKIISIKTQRYLGVFDLKIYSDETLDIPSGKEASFKSVTIYSGGELYIHGNCRVYDTVYVPEGSVVYVGEGGVMEVGCNA